MKKNVVSGLFLVLGLGFLALEINSNREAIFGRDPNAFAASILPDSKRSDSQSSAATTIQAAKFSETSRR